MRTGLFTLAAFAQLALLVTADVEPYKIPLYRRSSGDGIVTASGKALDNGVLAGTIQIGTPPQAFTVAFDTSSGYSWVRGSRCKSENCLDRCTYYARRSNTSQPTGKKFSVKYGSECVDTEIYLDTVNFAGLKVENMPFGGAYRMTGFADGFDGYLGLGPSINFNNRTSSKLTLGHLSKRDDTLSSSAFVANAYQQGAGVGSSQFGMYTTDNGAGFSQDGTSTTDTSLPSTTDSSAATTAASATTVAAATTAASTDVTSGGFGFTKRETSQDVAGYLVIGGIDTAIIEGNMTYLSLAQQQDEQQSWSVCLKHAKIGHPLPFPDRRHSETLATITSSNPYILLPHAAAFQHTYGGKYDAATNTFRIPCSETRYLPPLTLTLGEEKVTVQLPAVYWTRKIDDETCQVLLGQSPDHGWVLGAPFTNALYTTFDADKARIGLAIKKGNTNKDLTLSDSA